MTVKSSLPAKFSHFCYANRLVLRDPVNVKYLTTDASSLELSYKFHNNKKYKIGIEKEKTKKKAAFEEKGA